MEQEIRIRALINRLARLDAAESWCAGLNPTQVVVLDYLSRANRFSRSPSQVADYLGTTRGTVSQTLKSLVRKGYVNEHRSLADKRVVQVDLTDKGLALVNTSRLTEASLRHMSKPQKSSLEHTLTALLRSVQQLNDSRPFGVCRVCKYYQPRKAGGFCTLLSETLTALDALQICHEQAPYE